MNSKRSSPKKHLFAWGLILLPSLFFITFWGMTTSVNKLSVPRGYLDSLEAQGFSLGKLSALTHTADVKTGLASAPFTVRKGDSLAGYLQVSPRRARAKGQVQLGAMAITNGATTVVITSLDSVTVSASLRRDIAAALPKNIHLMTTASHIHSGPGGFGDGFLQRIFLGAADADLHRRLAAALTELSQKALANMQPAHIAYGQAGAEDLIRPRELQNSRIDTRIEVLQARRDDGKTLGAWIFYGAHPTLIADRQKADGDYPGVLCQKLQKEFSAPVLFTAGATGSASSALKDPNQEGRALAAVVENMPIIDQGGPSVLFYQRTKISMPPPNLPLFWGRTLQSDLSEFMIPGSLPVDVLRIGKIVLVSLPGELSAELSGALKRSYEQAGLQLIIAAHNGAYGGYFMPRTRYANGSIEAPLEFYGPMAGQVFVRFLTGLRWGLRKND